MGIVWDWIETGDWIIDEPFHRQDITFVCKVGPSVKIWYVMWISWKWIDCIIVQKCQIIYGCTNQYKYKVTLWIRVKVIPVGRVSLECHDPYLLWIRWNLISLLVLHGTGCTHQYQMYQMILMVKVEVTHIHIFHHPIVHICCESDKSELVSLKVFCVQTSHQYDRGSPCITEGWDTLVYVAVKCDAW